MPPSSYRSPRAPAGAGDHRSRRDAPRCAGEYKLVLRESGTPIEQVDITIVKNSADADKPAYPAAIRALYESRRVYPADPASRKGGCRSSVSLSATSMLLLFGAVAFAVICRRRMRRNA